MTKDAVGGERKVVLRWIDSVTGARVEQVGWRFCMLRPLQRTVTAGAGGGFTGAVTIVVARRGGLAPR